MRKTALAGLLTLLLAFAMVGCDLFGTTTVTTSSTTASTTTTTLPTTTTTVSEVNDLDLRLHSIYQLAVTSGSFTGTYEEWLETVRGPAGREIALQVSGGYVQWKYSTDTVWNNLIALTTLIGPAGSNGQNPTFRVSGTKLQWQYATEATWTDLFDLSLLTGDAGKEIDLRVDHGFLQWQKEGDLQWTNLIDLSTLVAQPTISISVDGYWVINGVQTEYPAVAQIIVQTVTVTFELDGGTLPEGYTSTMTVPKGDAMDLPIPVKEGYEFQGWITGTGMFDIAYNNFTPFVKNTTLHAVWEKNLDQILAFLNAPSGMNFSGRKQLTVYATIDGSQIVFQEVGEMKFMQKNGWTIRATLDQELDWIDNEWVVRHETQGYEQIHALAEGVAAERLTYQFHDGKWHLGMDEKAVRLETGFELFDPELFVKREGADEYDYPITTEQLILYGIPVGDEVVLSNVECYYNVAMNSIVISLEGTAKMDTDSYHPVRATLILTLYDVGTTVVEEPILSAKEAVHDMISQWVAAVKGRAQYLAAYPGSQLAFDLFAAEQTQRVADAETLLELYAIRTEAEGAILNYLFAYDELNLHKTLRLMEILGHLDWLCETATPVSCDQMRASFETNKHWIFEALDDAALSSAANAIYDALHGLYAEDPAAVRLAKQKERLLDFVEQYKEILWPYLMSDDTRQTIEMLVGTARANIQNAADGPLADQAYEEFYQALVALNLTYGDWSPARTFLLAQIEPWGVWIDLLMQEGYAIEPFADERYASMYQELTQIDDLLPLIHQTIVVYMAHEQLVMPSAIQRGVVLATGIKTEFLPLIESGAVAELELRYEEAKQRILSAEGLWDIEAAVDILRQIAMNLPRNDWNEQVAAAFFEMGSFIQSIAPSADPLSLTALDGLYLLAQTNIMQLPVGDEVALALAVEQWKTMFQLAYTAAIPDYDQFELVRWRADSMLFLDTIDRYTRLLLDPSQNLSVLDSWKQNYTAALAAATTVNAVLAVKQDATNAWLNMTLLFQTDFEWARVEFLAYVEDVRQEVLSVFGTIPDSLSHAFNTIPGQLTNQTNPMFLIMSGASAMNILPRSFRMTMQDAYFPSLLAAKNLWAEKVEGGSLALLTQIYNVAFTKINRAWTTSEVLDAYAAFETLAERLPKDAFKLARLAAADQLKMLYQELRATATSDSALAMAPLLDVGVGLILGSQTPLEVEANLTAAKHALQNAYAVDALLWNLHTYRGYYQDLGMKIVNDIMTYGMNEELDHLMMMSYYDVVDQWNEDTNGADMYLHYQNWIEYLDTLGYMFTKNSTDMLLLMLNGLMDDLDQLASYEVFQHPDVVSQQQAWIQLLGEANTPVEIIATRHMAYQSILDKAYVILYDGAVEQVQTLYGQYQPALSYDSLPLLEQYTADALKALRINPNRLDHSMILNEYHQKLSTLQ